MRSKLHAQLAGWIAAILVAQLLSAIESYADPGHDHGDHDSPSSGLGGFEPQFSLHGFSDVTFDFSHRSGSAFDDSSSNGFALGQFDLFFVSRLADNLSFLGESVFEFESSGETGVDVERVFIKYNWSDYLRLAAGRTHTALGYWNEAFHHGTLLQPTVERPEALKFEDDGGILPVHSVGIELSGQATSGDWELGYVANVANGRGPERDVVQGASDLNQDKALGAKLTLSHAGETQFAVGPAIHRDLIPSDPSVPGREGSIRESIPGFHIFFRRGPAEVVAEAYGIRHQDTNSRQKFYHRTGYALAVLGSSRWKPYFGVEAIDFAAGDPFFASDDRDLTRITAGLRYEPSPFNAIKAEYRHDRRGGKLDELLVQTAFTF